MLNYPQQQEPGMFPAIDELEQRVHPIVPYVLAACGAVGGYFFGLDQERFPVVLYVALGLVVGLLFTVLLSKLTTLLIALAIVAAAAFGTFWLLGNDAALKHRRLAPVTQAAPAGPAPASGLLDALRKAVQP